MKKIYISRLKHEVYQILFPFFFQKYNFNLEITMMFIGNKVIIAHEEPKMHKIKRLNHSQFIETIRCYLKTIILLKALIRQWLNTIFDHYCDVGYLTDLVEVIR